MKVNEYGDKPRSTPAFRWAGATASSKMRSDAALSSVWRKLIIMQESEQTGAGQNLTQTLRACGWVNGELLDLLLDGINQIREVKSSTWVDDL